MELGISPIVTSSLIMQVSGVDTVLLWTSPSNLEVDSICCGLQIPCQ